MKSSIKKGFIVCLFLVISFSFINCSTVYALDSTINDTGGSSNKIYINRRITKADMANTTYGSVKQIIKKEKE